MKILTLFATASLLMGSASFLHAQNRSERWSGRDLDVIPKWEIGVFGGESEYFGDLTPSSGRNYISEATPHAGLFARYYLGKNFSVRANIYGAKLAANDALYAGWRQHRNFSFTTMLYEGSVQLEYDLLHTNRDTRGGRWGIYGFAGLGFCRTNPKRHFENVDVNYFGYGDKATYGINADASTSPTHIALVAPLGLGVRYDLGPKLSIFAEGSVHQGFDDQIDGFSSSVSSTKPDAYAFVSLGLCMRLGVSNGWWR